MIETLSCIFGSREQLSRIQAIRSCCELNSTSSAMVNPNHAILVRDVPTSRASLHVYRPNRDVIINPLSPHLFNKVTSEMR